MKTELQQVKKNSKRGGEKWLKAIKREKKVRVKKLNECKINERIVCPNERESEAIWNGFILSMRMCMVYVWWWLLCMGAIFALLSLAFSVHCAFSTLFYHSLAPIFRSCSNSSFLSLSFFLVALCINFV